MLALKSIARAVPRSAFRAAPLRSSLRCIAVPKPIISSRTTAIKTFSTARTLREPAGDSDAELSAKFEHERSIEEQEIPNANVMPQELQDFLDESEFTITDQPGTENIVLTKKFGNELIRVECNIAEMSSPQANDFEDDDDALLDESDYESDVTSGGKRTINQTKGGKVDVAPEDSLAPSDRGDVEVEQEQGAGFPLTLNITIDKGAIGATNITARCGQDGQLEIEYVHYYPRAELVDSKTYEAHREANDVYGGPLFEHLDADLQQMYETYVTERGINERLSWFLQRYVDYKEQREYVQWLDNMKKFIDA